MISMPVGYFLICVQYAMKADETYGLIFSRDNVVVTSFLCVILFQISATLNL